VQVASPFDGSAKIFTASRSMIARSASCYSITAARGNAWRLNRYKLFKKLELLDVVE
jgi:hypothetical protein